jgi:hypothetical protein
VNATFGRSPGATVLVEADTIVALRDRSPQVATDTPEPL